MVHQSKDHIAFEYDMIASFLAIPQTAEINIGEEEGARRIWRHGLIVAMEQEKLKLTILIMLIAIYICL